MPTSLEYSSQQVSSQTSLANYNSRVSILGEELPILLLVSRHLLQLADGHFVLFIAARGHMAEQKRIDLRASKLSSRDLLLKQDIQFTIRPTLWFRKTKVCPDKAEETGSSPEESGFGAPIPSTWVEHTWCKDVGDDGANIIEVSSENDCFLAEAGGGEFSDEGVANWTDGRIVDEGEDEEHGTDGPLCGLVVF